ncbi:MAG: 4-oxalocrotonate tautomerase family protein [Kofleriaceae bacterium]
MPVVTVTLPAGSLDIEQKRTLITKITDVVLEVEGFPSLRPAVHVFIDELPDGAYGVGGKAIDVAALKASLSAAAKPRLEKP